MFLIHRSKTKAFFHWELPKVGALKSWNTVGSSGIAAVLYALQFGKELLGHQIGTVPSHQRRTWNKIDIATCGDDLHNGVAGHDI